jgi:hypothetical protein
MRNFGCFNTSVPDTFKQLFDFSFFYLLAFEWTMEGKN